MFCGVRKLRNYVIVLMLIKHNQKNLTLLIYNKDYLTKFSTINVETIIIDLNDIQSNLQQIKEDLENS